MKEKESVKEKIKVEALASDPNVLFINGKKFALDKITMKKIDKVEHMDKYVYREIKNDEFEKDVNLISETLGKQVDSSDIIKEVLKSVPVKTIRRIAKRIRDKKPIKRHYGCLGFAVGDAYISIVD
jgi:hypothetical protein